jgi:hypothetical protein
MNPQNDSELRNYLDSVYPRRQNLCWNGSFMVDQLWLGGANPWNATNFFPADGWNSFASTALTGTVQRGNVTGLEAYNVHYQLLHQVTVPAAPAAADQNICYTTIEGYDFSRLLFGTSYARPLAIGFWVASSLVGQHGGRITNAASNRNWAFTYNVFQSNVYEWKTIVIPGETTGVWDSTNGAGAFVVWDLGSGSNSETTSINSWITSGALPQRTSGCVRLTQSGGLHAIAGVKILPDYVDQNADEVKYSDVLMKARRYRPVFSAFGNFSGYSFSTTNGFYAVPFSVPTRVIPTGVAFTAGAASLASTTGGGTVAVTSTSLQLAGAESATINATCPPASFIAGDGSIYLLSGGRMYFTGAAL